MQVRVTGRHMGVSEDVKVYCRDKADRLTRFYDRISQIEVVLDGNSGRHSAEMIVHAEGADPFVAKEQHDDLYAAVDLVLEKVEGQLRRHKEKHRNRKHMVRRDEA